MFDVSSVKRLRDIACADIGQVDYSLLVRRILTDLQNSPIISVIVGQNANELQCHEYVNLIL
jgi:hypothetical protein